MTILPGQSFSNNWRLQQRRQARSLAEINNLSIHFESISFDIKRRLKPEEEGKTARHFNPL